MANRYLIAAGNSDNPAIYDGGTLPDPSDVLRLNNFAWTVVANITLAELRCDALAPAVATNTARIVTINDGVTLTCTTLVLGVQSTAEGLFRVAAGGTGTVVSPLLSRGISGVNAGETLNIIGAGDTTGTGGNAALIRGSGITNWTGNIVNPQGSTYIIDTVQGGTVNITGNVLQNGGAGIWVRTNHTLTVAGSITNSNIVFYDTTTTTFNTFTHYGQLTAGSLPVIRSRSPYRGTGPFINNGSVCAFAGDKLELIPNGGTYIELATTTPSTVRMYTPDLLSGYPPEADVETGVTYGPVGEFTGTLDPVTVNVTVDTNAIASAISTSLETSLPPLLASPLATDLLTEISSSPDPLAERLRNASTVQSTGAQIASLTIPS
jgi:hypothetical protein